jgi:polyketide biosynthesis acyl carrier protein
MSKEILDLIISHVREVIPELADHSFDAGDSLKALGANSVDRANIIMMTLESLSVRIPMIEMARAENIGDLAGIIHAKSQ